MTNTTVPTEPTDEMRLAGAAVFTDAVRTGNENRVVKRIYDAMLAAAPVPSPPGKEVREAVARIVQDVIVEATAPDDGLELKTLVGVAMKAARLVDPATERILALLTPAGEGWRPIESAPKDGTQVLTWGCLHDDGGVDMGETPSVQVSQMTEFGWSCPLLGGHYPTHWRPLPSPPVQPEGDR